MLSVTCELQLENTATMSESTVKKYKARDFVGDWIGGMVGGCVGTLAAQPLDTWRVRKHVNSEVQGLFDILHKEGVRGFYKGLVPPMVGQVGINLIVFGVEGNAKKLMGSIPEKYPFCSGLASGTFAGIVQSVVASPMELIKIQMQLKSVGVTRQPRSIAQVFTASPKSETNGKSYKGPLDVTKMIYQRRGTRGLYRGIAPTIWRDGIGFGIYFAVYDKGKEQLNVHDDVPLSCMWLLKSSIAGGLAGASSFVPIYPIDVIKTRIQKDMPENGNFKYKGIIDCGKKVCKEGGFRMLWKGLIPTILRGFVWSAVAFPAVEVVKMIFETSD